MNHVKRIVAAAAALAVVGAVYAAGPDAGQTTKQATNWTAITMFAIFVGITLWITKWAAAKTKTAESTPIQKTPGDKKTGDDKGAQASTATLTQKQPPAQSAVKPNRNAAKGAIAAAEEGDPDDDELILPKEFMLELGAGNCRELGVLRDKWNKGIDRQYFLRTPEGLGIAYTLLSRMAVPFPRFCEAMEKSGYLQETMVGGKKRRLAPLPFA